MSSSFPLTPAEAIAAAAFIRTHAAEKADLPAVADLLPRWLDWAERLARWGEANLALASNVPPCQLCGGEPASATGVCVECGHDMMGYYDDGASDELEATR